MAFPKKIPAQRIPRSRDCRADPSSQTPQGWVWRRCLSAL